MLIQSKLTWKKSDSRFARFRVSLLLNLLLPAVLVLFPARDAKAQMSLGDAVRRAVEGNAGIGSARRTVDAHESEVRAAWGRLFPSIGVDVMYTHMDKDLVLDLDPIRAALIQLQTGDAVSLANLESVLKQGRTLTPQEQAAVAGQANAKLEAAVPHFRETVKERTFPQAIVSLKQPIFTGGRILAGIRAARATDDLAHVRLDEQRLSIASEAITRYLDVLLANRNLALRKQALDAVQGHETLAMKLMEQGLIPMNDKLRADVALAEAERNLFEAEQKRAIALEALASVTGIGNPDISLSDSLVYHPFSISLDELLQQAGVGNTTARSADAAGRALHEKAAARLGEYFPTIYGFGMYNVFDHYMVKDMEPKWAVGLGLSWQLFDGMKRTNDYQQARAEAESMDLTAQEVRRKVALLVRSRFMNMQLAEARIRQLDRAEGQAAESSRLNTKRFSEGLGTSLEALDARLALDGIRLQRAAAVHEYYSDLCTLLQAAGNIEVFMAVWNGGN